MWHIFEKGIVQGYQKWYSHVSNAQIQKYKYTNIQIHKYSIWQSARKTQRVAYFWKEDCSRVSKMIIPGVKRANTKIQIQNTQIHHMVRCQKDPTCGIFLKRGLFKGIKNDNPMCQTCKNKKCKYTNKHPATAEEVTSEVRRVSGLLLLAALGVGLASWQSAAKLLASWDGWRPSDQVVGLPRVAETRPGSLRDSAGRRSRRTALPQSKAIVSCGLALERKTKHLSKLLSKNVNRIVNSILG